MNIVNAAFRAFSGAARVERSRIFRESFSFGPETRLLDLGSEDGSNIASVIDGLGLQPENVYIADIDQAAIERGRNNFGFNNVLLRDQGQLPFENGYFDIVYCSSVIEHVTVSKAEVWSITSGSVFRERADAAQTSFADEIKRIGQQYFVQTPNRTFPLESHTWLPLLGVLPRSLQVQVMTAANRVWVKRSIPDFNLLDVPEMQKLFPEAKIELEKKFGFIKSIMAIKSDDRTKVEV